MFDRFPLPPPLRRWRVTKLVTRRGSRKISRAPMFLVLGIVNELLRNRISHGANRFGLVIVSAVLKLETTTRLLFVSLSTCNQIFYTRIGVMFLFCCNFCCRKLEYIAEDRSRKISKFYFMMTSFRSQIGASLNIFLRIKRSGVYSLFLPRNLWIR